MILLERANCGARARGSLQTHNLALRLESPVPAFFGRLSGLPMSALHPLRTLAVGRRQAVESGQLEEGLWRYLQGNRLEQAGRSQRP